VEAWELDDDLLSIWVAKCDRRDLPWQVMVGIIGEFVRDDQLLAETEEAMVRSLSQVDGVADVAGEDYGVWALGGTVAGPALVEAAREALEPFRARVDREYQLVVEGAHEVPRETTPPLGPDVDLFADFPGVVEIDPELGAELIRRLRRRQSGAEE
jgi:hypothetical protein